MSYTKAENIIRQNTPDVVELFVDHWQRMPEGANARRIAERLKSEARPNGWLRRTYPHRAHDCEFLADYLLVNCC